MCNSNRSSGKSSESPEFKIRSKAYTIEYRLNVETESGEPVDHRT